MKKKKKTSGVNREGGCRLGAVLTAYCSELYSPERGGQVGRTI